MFYDPKGENMVFATHHSAEVRIEGGEPTFPPLDAITRPAVDTAAAAYYLNRKQQTLRSWACLECGPVRPLRVNGRLAWPVAEIRRLLGVA
jgi:hypothetical protein